MTPSLAIDDRTYMMDEINRHLERRRLLNSAVSLTALGTHFVSLLVAAMSQEEGKANWNTAEVDAFVDFLWVHRAEAGDGGSFKDTTFNAVAEHIADLWVTGPIKTAKRCKTKWTGVSLCYLPADWALTSCPQLKGIFRGIVTYKETTSGTHWDNVNGAGIDGSAASSAWDNYIKASKVCLEIVNLIMCSLTKPPFHAVEQDHDPLSDEGFPVFRQVARYHAKCICERWQCVLCNPHSTPCSA
jgi:hypothetical protein